MKSHFINAAFALFAALPAMAQTTTVQPAKPAASAPVRSAEQNQKIAEVAALCDAVLATSVNNLPKLFPKEKAYKAMNDFSAIGSKAIGADKYSALNTEKIMSLSAPLDVLKETDPVKYNETIYKHADAANKCFGFLAAGWPQRAIK